MTNEATLGKQLSEIAEAIGLDGALALCRVFGGIALYVPQTPKEDHILLKALSMDEFALLCRAFGGDTVEIPKGTKAKRAQIFADLAAGAGTLEAAKRYNYTTRGIRKLKAKLKNPANPNQHKLF